MKNFCITIFTLMVPSTNLVYGAEEGMPQLNTEFWIAQTFWLALIFSTLYIVIWKIFLPKITDVIENRKMKVVNDLNQAEKFKKNAEKKLKEYNVVIENSKKEAKKIIQDGRKRLDLDIEKKKKEFTEEIEKELLDAEKEIKILKKSSVSSINKIAVEISSELIKQIIETDSNMSNVSAIVENISKKKMEKNI